MGRLTIADGMVYLGKASDVFGQSDGSFIDPALPVGSAASATEMGYWPSYRRITPDCRQRYLEWLVSGKKAPEIDVGYVFLYFYGLERRLLVDTPSCTELKALIWELRRLRTIYSGYSSFDGYSSRLIEAADFLQTAADQTKPFIPDLTAPPSDMSPALKLAIARDVVAGRPLGFDFAAAALFGLREFWANRRHLHDEGRIPFLKLLRPRFATAFPAGFALRNRKDSALQIVYRGATAGLQVDLASRAGITSLPDPTGLTWTKLLAVAEAVADEIAPYVKALTYHPARANSIAGLVKCPIELRDDIAIESRRWLESLPSPASVAFGVLASHAIGIKSAKWTINHRRKISEALFEVGFAMEPGPFDSGDRMEDGTIVQVFRSDGGNQSRTMTVLSAATALVSAVIKANGGNADKIELFWLSQLGLRISLSSDDWTRLRARLAWFRTNDVTLAKAKRTLGDATLEERELCAWSATVAAGAFGSVGQPQIKMLEAIHIALNVPRSGLYTAMHASIGEATVRSDEPVAVTEAHPQILHPIPRPPVNDPLAPIVDNKARIRAETERVSALLADIFTDNGSNPAPPEADSQSPVEGLDKEHSDLVMKLIRRSEWTRKEFNLVVTEVGLMPDGAMETINEWSFDTFSDPLVEDGEPVVIHLELLPDHLRTATCVK